MAITIPGSITGTAQTGLTTPGYTTTVDTPPDVNAKQVAVTALTGTQSGVSAHSVSSPFTLTAFRPKVFQSLGKPNPVTGLISTVPRNTYKVLTRKGVMPAANQIPVAMVIRSEFDVPAGADTYDVNSVRAAISAHIGLLTSVSAGLGETTTSGIL